MAKEKEAKQAAEAEAVEVNLLDQIVEQGRFGKAPAAQERGRDMVKQFVADVLEGTVAYHADTDAMINARIAQIDQLLSAQVNEIVHAPEFQKLEASWRGLRYLLSESETSDQLKIKLLNVNKKDLLKDLQRAPEFDQSALFKKIYEEEYGVFGGSPFGAILGDYEFDKTGQDIELLDKISEVAAASHSGTRVAWPDVDSIMIMCSMSCPRMAGQSRLASHAALGVGATTTMRPPGTCAFTAGCERPGLKCARNLLFLWRSTISEIQAR